MVFLQIINVPAFLVLGVWIVGQFFSLGSMVESNVAYVAHIGGFFSGILLFLILKNKEITIFSDSKSRLSSPRPYYLKRSGLMRSGVTILHNILPAYRVWVLM